jgi:hypothetical protein
LLEVTDKPALLARRKEPFRDDQIHDQQDQDQARLHDQLPGR